MESEAHNSAVGWYWKTHIGDIEFPRFQLMISVNWVNEKHSSMLVLLLLYFYEEIFFTNL